MEDKQEVAEQLRKVYNLSPEAKPKEGTTTKEASSLNPPQKSISEEETDDYSADQPIMI